MRTPMRTPIRRAGAVSEKRPDADDRRAEPSVWGFVKWSAISLAAIVVLGAIAARLLHALGIG
jgi:hypothetical protein